MDERENIKVVRDFQKKIDALETRLNRALARLDAALERQRRKQQSDARTDGLLRELGLN